MRVGIAIIHDTDPASGVISDVTGSPDNHVAFRVVDARGDHKLEAIYRYGVVEDNWTILLAQKRQVVKLYEPEVFDLAPAINYARAQVGKPYSLWSIVGAGIGMLWGKLFGRHHNIFGGWNCSRLVMRALQAANYPGASRYDSGGATPAQVEELLIANHEPEWTDAA